VCGGGGGGAGTPPARAHVYLLLSQKERTDCAKSAILGVVGDEAPVVFVCPLYETLRVKYSELFRDATNLNSAFSAAQIAEFLYDCYLMHVCS
jgi:hypothetical protein